MRHLFTHTSGIPDYTDSLIDLQKDYTEDAAGQPGRRAAAGLSAGHDLELQQYRLRCWAR